MEKKEAATVELGNRIKSILDSKNIKLVDLAFATNIEASNLRKYIRGTREMRITTVLKVAAALGVSAGDLLNGLEIYRED